jgi:hypothetical protein
MNQLHPNFHLARSVLGTGEPSFREGPRIRNSVLAPIDRT